MVWQEAAKYKVVSRLFRVLFSVSFALLPMAVGATDFTSSSFKVRDPILQIGGGEEMSSASFRLLGSVAQIAIGTSSITSFQVYGGFLYYPTVTKPVAAATAGDAQVSLSWTASQGFLGWNVSGYNVGQATVSEGPYSYTSLGNVTLSTRGGLTNGTTFYFVIRAEDAFGNSLATSSQVSATPVAAPAPPPPAPLPAGGGGFISEPQVTGVKFSGLAYPDAGITLLRDGTVLEAKKASTLGEFSFSYTNVTPGVYSYSLFAEDKKGTKSVALSFSITVVKNAISMVGNILIPPTIELERTELQRGEFLNVEGYAARLSQVESTTLSEEIVTRATSTLAGLWNAKVDTSPLEEGFHITKAKTIITDGRASTFSAVRAFRIGKGFPVTRGQCQGADFNLDGRVNLVDFSIMLFFWKSRNPANPCVDINADGMVDLVDFSILLFQWTG